MKQKHFKMLILGRKSPCSNIQDVKKMLNPDDEIVIHCSNPLSPASIIGYQILIHNGYRNGRRYASGISDWEEAGYPLEGTLVD